MSITVRPSDIEWSRSLYRALKDGGLWPVPRSGLLFEKHDGPQPRMHLRGVMPFEPRMPGTPEMWRAYQEDDFDAIRQVFKEAGIAITGNVATAGAFGSDDPAWRDERMQVQERLARGNSQ